MIKYVNKRQSSFEKWKKKDYLKGVFVYPEVSCCHVTAIVSSATKGGNSSRWFQTLDWFFYEAARNKNFFLFASAGVLEGGLYEERKLYIKRRLSDINDLCAKTKWDGCFLSSLSLSLTSDSFYHITQLRVTVYFLWLTWLICDVTQWQMST